jgi:hypothetical protein
MTLWKQGSSAVPVLASDSFVVSGGAGTVGRHDAGRAVRSARGTGGAGGSVSRARAINRHELPGNEAGQAAPPRYADDGHDDHGRADATRSKLGNERYPDRQHAVDADAGGSKNDPKTGKNGVGSPRPCGRAPIRKRVGRAKLLEFFAALPPCLVGIEACSDRTSLDPSVRSRSGCCARRPCT